MIDIKSKENKIFKISQAIFALEASKGHLKWKVTALVSKTGVSRTLIYRYFGSSKKEILLTALRSFSKRFFRLDCPLPLSAESFTQEIVNARSILEENFEAIIFYQKWSDSESYLKEEFVKIEEQYQQKIKDSFPMVDTSEILLLHSCIHGFVTSPFISPETLNTIFPLFLKKFKT